VVIFVPAILDRLGAVPRKKEMLKGHLPRVIHHPVYNVYQEKKNRIHLFQVVAEQIASEGERLTP